MTTMLNDMATLSDQQLCDALVTMTRRDRSAQVDFLWHLAELDRRKLHLDKGYPSLWEYCRRDLKLSEGDAGRRIAAARALVKAPQAADRIREGSISLCVFAVLARILTEANAAELLDRSHGLSKRETEDLVAALTATSAPLLLRRDVIRVVAQKPAASSSSSFFNSTDTETTATHFAPTDAAPDLVHRISFDADDEIVAQIRRLQELLGERELKEVIRRANALLLDKVDPERRHARRVKRDEKKTTGPQSAKKTHVAAKHRQPISVRDAVSVRDGGQCTFVSRDGVRCCARTYLHVDHVRPFALGGSSTSVENNRLLCSAHNLMRAKVTFGEPWRAPR